MEKAIRTAVAVKKKENETQPGEVLFFKTGYGCLVLYFRNGIVDMVSMYNKEVGEAELCL